MIHVVRAVIVFFFNDTATTEIYTLSLHDALPISTALPTTTAAGRISARASRGTTDSGTMPSPSANTCHTQRPATSPRSEEHTSELQSRQYLVCRLLLEKKKRYFLPFVRECRDACG